MSHLDLNIMEPPSVIKRICERYRNGYSPIVVFVGKMRVGKTTKAYLMFQWISWLLFNEPWDWRKGTMINFDQILKELDNPDIKIKLADEVQRMFEKKDYMKEESKLFNKLLTSQAYLHYIFGMILPKASALGSDHASNVDYVIYVKNRREVLPYKLENNLWDINLKKRDSRKFYLKHFKLDIKNPLVKKAFADELKDLEEFKKYISVNLKEKTMDEVKEKRGLKKSDYDEFVDNCRAAGCQPPSISTAKRLGIVK